MEFTFLLHAVDPFLEVFPASCCSLVCLYSPVEGVVNCRPFIEERYLSLIAKESDGLSQFLSSFEASRISQFCFRQQWSQSTSWWLGSVVMGSLP